MEKTIAIIENDNSLRGDLIRPGELPRLWASAVISEASPTARRA